MTEEISKVYEPKQIEDKLYKFWTENRLFNAKKEEGKKPFTIVIPPPNVTGSLHMGHALNNTLQDISIRFKTMMGFNALWVPGTDHGGIASQNVVEKQLIAQGKTRHDLGREKFIERMWEWRKETGDTILKQLEKLGCSLDMERTRFTMDEVCSRAVVIAFVELYNRGQIYRGKRLVNWCPRCNTALSDIEVEHEEEVGKLWHIKYDLVEDKEKPKKTKTKSKTKKNESSFIIVATTRPETMLGDTAVAVHPDDKRYKKLVGKLIKLPLLGREIPIVADKAVDPTFGTGAVKVTPAHDPTDFDIGARHKLAQIVVIDFKGKMTAEAGQYAGLDRYAARKKILEDLEKEGLLLETTNHPHSIGHCYRCDTVIEPLVSEQWFLKVDTLSKRAIKVVEEGKIKFYPKSWEKPYLTWLENLRDWCISRQIWWGHRIPVYYCENGKEQEKTKTKKAKLCPPIVAIQPPKECPYCGSTKIEQDPDVLDTWFSSALWPFSVFGWPKTENEFHNSDLHYFYPTSVLVTGHEILYLWVARMVQMGLEFMGDVPFSEVFIHGIVRDKHGKKMSKSLGNVIDPLEIINKYGADALRFSITQSAAPGRDMQLSEDSFVGARNFTNKLWNASRFVFMNVQTVKWEPDFLAVWPLELADRWILSEYRILVRDVTEAYNKYDMDSAARLLYDFFWSKYCDWYIELSKIRLNGQDEQKKKMVLSVLCEVLQGLLKLMHPIMPFITEELWQALTDLTRSVDKKKTISILKSHWPQADQGKIEPEAIENMKVIQNIVTSVRTVRSEMDVPPGKTIQVMINANSEKLKEILNTHVEYLKSLMKADSIEISQGLLRPEKSVVAVASGAEIFIPLKGLIDSEKEKQRLLKELSVAQADEEFCKKRMENKEFVSRAPQKEIDKITNRLNDDKTKIEKIKENLKTLE
jgi:valyl-tRNA synthetase